MKFKFLKNLPEHIVQKPVLISGNRSESFPNSEYLLVEKDHIEIPFEIKYEYNCSPFREAMMQNDVLAVGFEEYFYLFHLKHQRNILSLKMNGYFGHLYFHQNLFYVADACGIHCIDTNGKLLWQNQHLGIDGVIITHFEANKIYGEAEQNPPNGWEAFVLDLSTGKRLSF